MTQVKFATVPFKEWKPAETLAGLSKLGQGLSNGSVDLAQAGTSLASALFGQDSKEAKAVSDWVKGLSSSPGEVGAKPASPKPGPAPTAKTTTFDGASKAADKPTPPSVEKSADKATPPSVDKSADKATPPNVDKPKLAKKPKLETGTVKAEGGIAKAEGSSSDGPIGSAVAKAGDLAAAAAAAGAKHKKAEAEAKAAKKAKLEEKIDMPSKPVGANKFPGVPVDAPIKSEEGDRSKTKYGAVIDQFQVDKNIRYEKNRQGKGETYCNIFANDVTKAMGAEIPHTYNDKTGEPGPGAYQHNANGMVDWLHKHGEKKGWKKVSPEEAQAYANKGKPAVATYKNDGGTGHFGVIRPGEMDPEKGPALSQAGANNIGKGHVQDGFGKNAQKQAEYWVHE